MLKLTIACGFVLLLATGLLLVQGGRPTCANEPDNQARNEGAIDRALAKSVAQYDELLKQMRFRAAVAVAKNVQHLQQGKPIGELMERNARRAKKHTVSRLHRLLAFEAICAKIEKNGDSVVISPRPMALHQARIAEGSFEELVFGTGLDGFRRMDLYARLEQRVASIDRVCQLTDAQKRKLELAGRGDIKRISDRIESLRKTFRQVHVVNDIHDLDDDDIRDLSTWTGALSIEAATLHEMVDSGLFDVGSLFGKTLRSTLTAEQAAVYDKARPTPR